MEIKIGDYVYCKVRKEFGIYMGRQTGFHETLLIDTIYPGYVYGTRKEYLSLVFTTENSNLDYKSDFQVLDQMRSYRTKVLKVLKHGFVVACKHLSQLLGRPQYK